MIRKKEGLFFGEAKTISICDSFYIQMIHSGKGEAKNRAKPRSWVKKECQRCHF